MIGLRQITMVADAVVVFTLTLNFKFFSEIDSGGKRGLFPLFFARKFYISSFSDLLYYIFMSTFQGVANFGAKIACVLSREECAEFLQHRRSGLP